ncbi:unnamed protein product [Adineta ricciae]|uniref:Uncharacterized protein n=1 Tax=Adineta ricciae TaxID=249248 RepID=A0A815H7D8_ADIRI|nr:unnamed protein product [Adineta ricciae]CAF1438677.1 unnamed protein product [Adineta ricciae]
MRQQKESVPLAGSVAAAASPNYVSAFQSQYVRHTNNSSELKKTNPCKIILGIIIFLAILIIFIVMYILFKQYAAEENIVIIKTTTTSTKPTMTTSYTSTTLKSMSVSSSVTTMSYSTWNFVATCCSLLFAMII